jgi:hypothetical protein
MASLLQDCKRRVVARPDIYFGACEKAVQVEIKDRALKASRVPPAGSELTYLDTLSEYQKCHLEDYRREYKEYLNSGFITEGDACIVDLCHSPISHGKIDTETLGTLTRNQHKYSFIHGRGLLGSESLAAQCIPTDDVLKGISEQDGVSLTTLKSLIWTPKPALSSLQTAKAKSVAGNAMHLAVAGTVIGWMFAHLVPDAKVKLHKSVREHLPQHVSVLTSSSQAGSSSSSVNSGSKASRAFSIGCRCSAGQRP